MNVRSFIGKIFGSEKDTVAPQKAEVLEIIEGEKAIFTPYKGDFFNDPDVLACVDAIARNGAKMHPKHLRRFDGKVEYLYGNIYKIIAKQPNELQNAYKFYYEVISNLELYNNAFIYKQTDENLKLTALYPLNFNEVKLYEYQNKIYVKFKFARGKERFVPYSDCIHLTRFTGEFGGSTLSIRKVLSTKHILDEGIINAIKLTQSIRGVLKSMKTLLKPEDVKKMRDQFVEDFASSHNKSGIGGLDASTEFTPIKLEPTTASDKQMETFDKKILNYFGVSEHIIQSNYTEDEWNAFYESILEPIGIQMGLEFSNKVFTPTQKYFGNEILFECNRLQYASNKTKVELIRYCGNVIKVNEQREILNLGPVEDGDVFIIDQNHEVSEKVGKNEGN